MFTRCPECNDVHRLDAGLLADAAGRVRCGRCEHEFNALTRLFDHWPDQHTRPPPFKPGDATPVLGRKESTQDSEVDLPPGPDSRGELRRDPNRAAWIAMFVILLLITASNLAWTFREPLLANEHVRKALVGAGLAPMEETGPFRDSGRLHLVSRDMHKHPSRTGMLALSVVFVNRADQPQPYPGLEVTLTDASGLALARREFSAGDYLPGNGDRQALLAPNVHIPILLEFEDPGDNAVGFEISFR